MLARIKINFTDGNLGIIQPSEDGLGILLCGKSIENDFFKKIYGEEDFKTLLNVDDVPEIVKAFYANVPTNTPVYVSNKKTSTDLIADIVAEKGAPRWIVAEKEMAATDNVLTALNSAIETLLADKYMPMFMVVPYNAENVSTLTISKERTAIVSHEFGDNLLGAIAARLAINPIQRSIARVRDEAIIKTGNPSAAPHVIDSANCIGLMTYIGKEGYFLTSDTLLIGDNSDYNTIARRRTIDKAYRIAYNVLLNHLHEEIPITNAGCIAPAVVKSWEQELENAIYRQMTLSGELGIDPNDDTDKGVKCYIDPTQQVASTSKIEINLSVKPYGYAKYIDVNLGFINVMEA